MDYNDYEDDFDVFFDEFIYLVNNFNLPEKTVEYLIKIFYKDRQQFLEHLQKDKPTRIYYDYIKGEVKDRKTGEIKC